MEIANIDSLEWWAINVGYQNIATIMERGNSKAIFLFLLDRNDDAPSYFDSSLGKALDVFYQKLRENLFFTISQQWNGYQTFPLKNSSFYLILQQNSTSEFCCIFIDVGG